MSDAGVGFLRNMDVLDGGMLVGEKILLSSNLTKNRSKNATDRKSARARASARKHRARLNMKSREADKEEDFETVSSSISSDTDSEEPETGTKTGFSGNKDEADESNAPSRKDSGLPSSRSSLSSIASLQQPDLSPEVPAKVEPVPEPAPTLKLSKNAEQVRIWLTPVRFQVPTGFRGDETAHRKRLSFLTSSSKFEYWLCRFSGKRSSMRGFQEFCFDSGLLTPK